MAAMVRSAGLDVPARSGGTHRGDSGRTRRLWASGGALRLANERANPLRCRPVGLRATPESGLKRRRTGAACRSAGVCSKIPFARDDGGVWTAAQDAPPIAEKHHDAGRPRRRRCLIGEGRSRRHRGERKHCRWRTSSPSPGSSTRRPGWLDRLRSRSVSGSASSLLYANGFGSNATGVLIGLPWMRTESDYSAASLSTNPATADSVRSRLRRSAPRIDTTSPSVCCRSSLIKT